MNASDVNRHYYEGLLQANDVTRRQGIHVVLLMPHERTFEHPLNPEQRLRSTH